MSDASTNCSLHISPIRLRALSFKKGKGYADISDRSPECPVRFGEDLDMIEICLPGYGWTPRRLTKEGSLYAAWDNMEIEFLINGKPISEWEDLITFMTR